jgi:hypothetical protein
MPNAEWFEVTGTGAEFSNEEGANAQARDAACGTDRAIEVYRCTRTLVRTYQRNVEIEVTEADQAS